MSAIEKCQARPGSNRRRRREIPRGWGVRSQRLGDRLLRPEEWILGGAGAGESPGARIHRPKLWSLHQKDIISAQRRMFSDPNKDKMQEASSRIASEPPEQKLISALHQRKLILDTFSLENPSLAALGRLEGRTSRKGLLIGAGEGSLQEPEETGRQEVKAPVKPVNLGGQAEGRARKVEAFLRLVAEQQQMVEPGQKPFRRSVLPVTKGSQEQITKKLLEQMARRRQEEIVREHQEQITREHQNEMFRRHQEEMAKGHQEDMARRRQEEMAKGHQEDMARRLQEEIARVRQEKMARGLPSAPLLVRDRPTGTFTVLHEGSGPQVSSLECQPLHLQVVVLPARGSVILSGSSQQKVKFQELVQRKLVKSSKALKEQSVSDSVVRGLVRESEREKRMAEEERILTMLLEHLEEENKK